MSTFSISAGPYDTRSGLPRNLEHLPAAVRPPFDDMGLVIGVDRLVIRLVELVLIHIHPDQRTTFARRRHSRAALCQRRIGRERCAGPRGDACDQCTTRELLSLLHVVLPFHCPMLAIEVGSIKHSTDQNFGQPLPATIRLFEPRDVRPRSRCAWWRRLEGLCWPAADSPSAAKSSPTMRATSRHAAFHGRLSGGNGFLSGRAFRELAVLADADLKTLAARLPSQQASRES